MRVALNRLCIGHWLEPDLESQWLDLAFESNPLVVFVQVKQYLACDKLSMRRVMQSSGIYQDWIFSFRWEVENKCFHSKFGKVWGAGGWQGWECLNPFILMLCKACIRLYFCLAATCCVILVPLFHIIRSRGGQEQKSKRNVEISSLWKLYVTAVFNGTFLLMKLEIVSLAAH